MQLDEEHQFISRAVTFAKYNVNPLGSIEFMINRPGSFQYIMRIDPILFLTKVVAPMMDCIRLPREYILRDEYNVYKVVKRMRRCQMNAIDRCVRWWLGLRNVPFVVLACYYDHHPSTVCRDFHHLCFCCLEKLGPTHLSHIIPHSEEYYDKLGTPASQHFPNALYALDVVKVI